MVSKGCSADPKGCATSSKGICEYVSLMTTLRFTYFLNYGNEFLSKVSKTSAIGFVFISYDR